MDIGLHEFKCEVCDKTETLTNDDAYASGWDYPPFIGAWGVISPRTCGSCGMDETAWWAITTQRITSLDDLSERHRETVQRILAEVQENPEPAVQP